MGGMEARCERKSCDRLAARPGRILATSWLRLLRKLPDCGEQEARGGECRVGIDSVRCVGR